MLKSVRAALQAAVFASTAFAAGSAFAVEPTGLWYDHTGRGAVEITPMGADRLKVMGYMGSKMLSETMMWKRAPANLKRCGA